MVNGSEDERREHARVHVDITLEILPLPENQSVSDVTPLHCLCRDISGGGVSFYTTERYSAESLMRVHIPLDGTFFLTPGDKKKTLNALGKIMWCKKNGKSGGYTVALQFLNIYEQDYNILNEYVMGHLKN